ncbi:BREX-2 system adenine-specific DNA-methyltransferase PglX [Saccharothrix violaceirubra]|nr:BREX-2 system adenine-specific DNA-methyltransferase PglX [Saccharothrix violaceirubra]
MEGHPALATRGLDQDELVKDLRKQVVALENDLRVRGAEEEFETSLRAEYDQAWEAKRTAATFDAWREDRITQVAAAWVLGTVFVRFCEDNGLIEWPFLAGPGERLADAEERHEAFFRENPRLNDRDWLVAAFDHLSDAHPTVAGLFDKRHNPLWEITPSFEAATALIGFWRRRGDDGGIRHDFTDPEWNTRFLGDLYQNLSEQARKTYALLQTPEFVEEFILDLTLEPAVEEFGLKGLRTIDPTCGSGHFLLGLFRRLLAKWQAKESGTEPWVLIRRSLESVHGCDKNPFAASIARFRLLVAALHAAEATRLDRISADFPINVAVGDSLLHGRGTPGVQVDLFEPVNAHTYRPEDVEEYSTCDLLGISSYHVVVGNPPYITVKDKRENENYRSIYDACSGTYALSVPFAQRFFQLAVRANGSDENSGHVGQITANSFMKREFGKKLIENFFPSIHLTHIIDTSGAFIPGHGTPTTILVGRNHHARMAQPVRGVLGVRGEPSQPEDPSQGLVWSAIVDHVHNPGANSDWISVEEIERGHFGTHPWSLSGGGAGSLQIFLERACSNRLGAKEPTIGFGAVTRADDAYAIGGRSLDRHRIPSRFQRPTVDGESIRDWSTNSLLGFLWPYDTESPTLSARTTPAIERLLWANRATLQARIAYGSNQTERGLEWFEYSMFFWRRYLGPTLSFAFVATHNHFVLDHGSKVFKQSAPMIKLPATATEDDHLALLGVLNSSTACFWLKQVCHDKGSQSGTGGFMHDEWERFYEFTGTKLQEFPLPAALPLEFGQALDGLAQELARLEPSAVADREVPAREILKDAQAEQEHIRARMIALQEELDWQVYGSYGLLTDAEVARLTAPDLDSVPEIKLGERAFEIVLARKVAAGNAETVWFDRHGSTPITEIPDHWPDWYREIVQERIDTITRRRDLALIERPECKRRWSLVPWEKREAEALRDWLLDRCENPDLWYALRDTIKQPRALTVNQLADKLGSDADLVAVAQLYATDHLGKRDLTLAETLERIVADQHVPYLAALRYKDSGLRKRAEWENVWELQREEDRTGRQLDIPVPSKYGSGDFRRASYWSQRGKLDVPKERFVSYPDANPDSDPTLLLGWAGWDHRDQAQAIVNVVNDRVDQSGWDSDRITPLLAGLLELLPWVRQWHGEYDDEWGGIPAEEYSAYLTTKQTTHQLTEDDLRTWRPAAPTRGRRAAGKD